MLFRKADPFLECDVFHVSGDLMSNDVIQITGNFYASCGRINVAGIAACGDIILDADCMSDNNVISAGFLVAGGKIVIRNFENDVQEYEAQEGMYFSFDGPWALSDPDSIFDNFDDIDIFEDSSDNDCDGEYAIQDRE